MRHASIIYSYELRQLEFYKSKFYAVYFSNMIVGKIVKTKNVYLIYYTDVNFYAGIKYQIICAEY